MARTLRIKDHWREQHLFTGRLLVSIVIVLGLTGLVVARLVQLQVGQYEYFSAQSSGNRIRVQPIPPIRGLILDRNGKVLAENTPSYQLEMTRGAGAGHGGHAPPAGGQRHRARKATCPNSRS